jgi:hypothetical protein
MNCAARPPPRRADARARAGPPLVACAAGATLRAARRGGTAWSCCGRAHASCNLAPQQGRTAAATRWRRWPSACAVAPRSRAFAAAWTRTTSERAPAVAATTWAAPRQRLAPNNPHARACARERICCTHAAGLYHTHIWLTAGACSGAKSAPLWAPGAAGRPSTRWAHTTSRRPLSRRCAAERPPARGARRGAWRLARPGVRPGGVPRAPRCRCNGL